MGEVQLIVVLKIHQGNAMSRTKKSPDAGHFLGE
jgi:hypothetical protein